jgi:hypothetical protein
MQAEPTAEELRRRILAAADRCIAAGKRAEVEALLQRWERDLDVSTVPIKTADIDR